MTIEIHTAGRDEGPGQILAVWLCRVAGLILFTIGIVYWVRMIGLVDGTLWRFDLMPLSWRIACPVLAVLCPVAGIGLWMLTSWGIVMWVLVAVVEGVMHLGLPDLFGPDPWRVAAHVAGITVLLTLRVLTLMGERRRQRGRHLERRPVSNGERVVDPKAKNS